MTIENSDSNDFLSSFVNSIEVFHCLLSGVDLDLDKCIPLQKNNFELVHEILAPYGISIKTFFLNMHVQLSHFLHDHLSTYCTCIPFLCVGL